MGQLDYRGKKISTVDFIYLGSNTSVTLVSRGKLTLNNLGKVPYDESAQYQTAMLKQKWDQTPDRLENALLKIVASQFKMNLVQLFVLNLIMASLEAAMPFMLREIMDYIQSKDPTEGFTKALFFTVLMLLTMLVSRLLKEYLKFGQLAVAVKANQALSGLVYRKSLMFSLAANKSYSKGRIIGMIQTDAPKVEFLFDTFPTVSKIPLLM